MDIISIHHSLDNSIMKKLLAMLCILVFAGCSIPKNPKLSFGKKCVEKVDSVVYSYVWVYNEESGLEADEENCKLIGK